MQQWAREAITGIKTPILSITLDNGSEFAGYAGIEQIFTSEAYAFEVYFASTPTIPGSAEPTKTPTAFPCRPPNTSNEVF